MARRRAGEGHGHGPGPGHMRGGTDVGTGNHDTGNHSASNHGIGAGTGACGLCKAIIVEDRIEHRKKKYFVTHPGVGRYRCFPTSNVLGQPVLVGKTRLSSVRYGVR